MCLEEPAGTRHLSPRTCPQQRDVQLIVGTASRGVRNGMPRAAWAALHVGDLAVAERDHPVALVPTAAGTSHCV